jgi:prephenate dehydrogenase
LKPIARLVVIGVGLIGGSVALALRNRGLVEHVVGIGRTQRNLDDAKAADIVDEAITLDGPWTSSLRDADVVLVATPVGQMPALFSAMANSLGPSTIVTDAGSTKQDVVAAARAHLGAALPRFVAAHPVAGTENSGAKAAVASLFENRNVIVSPLEETEPEAVVRVRSLWEACGANVVELDARQHDRVLAAISHLPHLLAAAYVADLAVRADAPKLFAHAGTGFRDFTRIAAASPEMWRDITLANLDALVDEIAAFRGALDVVESAMRERDGESLRSLFETASDARRAWGRGRDGETPGDGEA